MRIVSIGDLVTDFYYKNGNSVWVDGGMTSHNIVANISKQKWQTAILGVCGNDSTGKIAIKSLEDIGVNVQNIEIIPDLKTRCFHVSYIQNGDKLEFQSKNVVQFVIKKIGTKKVKLKLPIFYNKLKPMIF